MVKFVVRIVKLALKFGLIKDVYKFVYTGKGVSLNEFYSQGHWSRRSKIKNKYKAIFEKMLEGGKIEWMDQFSLLILYNSRHDPDNVTGMEKVFMDTLKGDYITDDNKKFYRGFAIFPDESLPTNTFEFYLLPHGNNEARNQRRHNLKVDAGQTQLRL